MLRCTVCGRPAVYCNPYSGAALCASHLLRSVERKFSRALASAKPREDDKMLLVDHGHLGSATALYLLYRVEKRHKGVKLTVACQPGSPAESLARRLGVETVAAKTWRLAEIASRYAEHYTLIVTSLPLEDYAAAALHSIVTANPAPLLAHLRMRIAHPMAVVTRAEALLYAKIRGIEEEREPLMPTTPLERKTYKLLTMSMKQCLTTPYALLRFTQEIVKTLGERRA